ALASEMEKSLLNRRSELGEEELRSSIITLKHGFDQDDFTQEVDAHGPIDRPTLLEPLDHFLKLDERSLHRVTPPYGPRNGTGSFIGLVRFHESPPVVGEYKRVAGDVMFSLVVRFRGDFPLLEVLIDEGLSRLDQPRLDARPESLAERIHPR